ncbi:MAG: hypothetical protein LBG73_06315 [Spirochaetaceae bacterium]|jgi:hypothetical protein|nr:hypothetical protein [Spirochaetaceae bacterium]
MAEHIYQPPMNPVRFVVLIPHRDAAGIIEDYKRRLFRAGAIGAYSFPIAAPLAAVSRPFTPAELKAEAYALRESSGAEGKDGKIAGGGLQILRYPPEEPVFTLFGLSLDASPPNPPSPPAIYRFPSLVLCAGVFPPCPDIPPPPCFFRAAMVANMAIRPLASGTAGYSFEWKIGVPVWLPKRK